MQPPPSTGIVYHGTDAASAESIQQIGLDRDAWRAAAADNVDEMGFSVTADRATAEVWARTRAVDRGGPPAGVVSEADAGLLPLRAGGPDEWTDPNEWFIGPEDFDQVGPGVFQ